MASSMRSEPQPPSWQGVLGFVSFDFFLSFWSYANGENVQLYTTEYDISQPGPGCT